MSNLWHNEHAVFHTRYERVTVYSLTRLFLVLTALARHSIPPSCLSNLVASLPLSLFLKVNLSIHFSLCVLLPLLYICFLTQPRPLLPCPLPSLRPPFLSLVLLSSCFLAFSFFFPFYSFPDISLFYFLSFTVLPSLLISCPIQCLQVLHSVDIAHKYCFFKSGGIGFQ